MLKMTKELEEKQKKLYEKIKNGEEINIEGINFYAKSVDWLSENDNRPEIDLTIVASDNQEL